jgi:hypothetical protein
MVDVVSFATSAKLVKRVARCSHAAAATPAFAPTHGNSDTTVLVSATFRTIGPSGQGLGVDFQFGQRVSTPK